MAESSIFKRHPIAVTLYALYILGWVWLAYIAYLDFTGYGGGETIMMCLVGFALFVTLPFLIGALIFTALSKTASKFYFRLALLILAPTPLAFLAVLLGRTSLG